MQLGARWRAGETPHRGVPELLHPAIASAETAHASGASWTLTWLEGRPRVELFCSDGEVLADLRVDAQGFVTESAVRAGDRSGDARPLDDEDDDDWLI